MVKNVYKYVKWLDKYSGYINIEKMKKRCKIVLKLIPGGEMVKPAKIHTFIFVDRYR